MSKLKKIICSITILTTVMGFNYIYGATKEDLNEIDDKIEKTNTEIANVKGQMSEELSQITKLNTNISLYEDDIENLENKIKVLDNDIIEKQKSIDEQEKKYNESKELLDKRLVAMYESGGISYLDVLLASDSFSDFISKYYIISVIAEADGKLLEDIENIKEQMIKDKETLEKNKEEVKKSKTELDSKKAELSNSINKKQNLVANLSNEEKELEKQLQEYEEDRRAMERELSKVVSKNNKEDISQTPSASGYISPLKGKTKSNITTDYYEYYKHTGVDFAIAGGTQILCVKDGTVAISTALRNPDGSYRSYGEYVAIDHHDGTVTIYAHMKPGSRRVSPGEKVSQGQVIGLVGMTGRATGNHLHFEVRINNGKKDVDPKPYLP